MKPWVKLLIEAGPLVVFFVVNGRDGLPELRPLWLDANAAATAQQGLFEATGGPLLFDAVRTFPGLRLELGMLATNSPDADLGRLARRTALNLQRILLGESAGTLPVLPGKRFSHHPPLFPHEIPASRAHRSNIRRL